MDNSNKTLHIFGGGLLVGVAEQVAIDSGWDVVLRTGERFLTSLPKLNSSTIVLLGNSLSKLMEQGVAPKPIDIGLSISAPWIFKSDTIMKFHGRLFNIHNQPLPFFKGAGGSSWRILMNDFTGGSCIHILNEGIDEGKIVSRIDFNFPKECLFPQDFDKITFEYSKKLLSSWLSKMMSSDHKIENLPDYDDSTSEYWPRLNTLIHGWINWDWKLYEIKSFCEAFAYPHRGAITSLRGKNFFIRGCSFILQQGKFHPFQTGLIYNINQSKLFVAHKDGTLVIEDYDFEETNLTIRLGDRLFSPLEKLENALKTRIQYLPDGSIIVN